MKKIFLITFFCFFWFLIIACSAPANDNHEVNKKTIDGVEGIKFETSFDELLIQTGWRLFNPASVQICIDDLAFKGCSLFPRDDTTSYINKAGIPYGLGVSFNKFDKLKTISLQFNRTGNMSREECLDVHQRTIDWLTDEYGEVIEYGEDTEETGSFEYKSTPQGNRHRIWTSNEGSTMIARGKIPLTNNQEVFLVSYYIKSVKNYQCSVIVDIGEKN